MKVKTNKRHRRIVRFFTTCYGFREPYKVLCDGNFIHHLLTNNMPSADRALSDSLRGRTKPFTTRCVLGELKSLGASFNGTLEAASSLIIARCDHEKRISAAQCIQEVIGEENSEHFFVATQDTDLRETLEQVPGVPVLYGLRNALFLDPPSESQRQHAVDMEEKRLHASESEMMLLQKRRKGSDLGTEITADAPEGEENSIVNSQMLARRDSTRRAMNMMDKAKFKRKRAQGPNPLSRKTKKSHGEKTPPASNPGGKEEGNASKKRIRKRKRSRKGSNQVGGDTAE
ncbi:hypothetical protein ACHQM5_006310 [Ranunculus cassubicifolius]